MSTTCKTCALRRPQDSLCLLNNRKVHPENDFCSKHQQELSTCSICGQPMIDFVIEINEDQVRFVCINCHSLSNTCTRCRNKSSCAFETDPSPIPKVVEKTIKQGPMISVTKVKNPSRIDITCREKCSCFDPSFGCLKENNTCANYIGDKFNGKNRTCFHFGIYK